MRRHEPGEPLTEAQVRTLELVARGMTYKEIGAQLYIEPATVRNRLMITFRKLDARNAAHAVARAIAYGWLDVSRPICLQRPVPDRARTSPRKDWHGSRRRTLHRG